ncbi:MAG TPA: YhcH/YjgK/YiaL family protein [Luteolibacter sp.]
MALFGSLETVRSQAASFPALATAFAHVERYFTAGSPEQQRLAALNADESGRVDLDHGVFALEQCYLTKPSEAVKWEAHKVYLDVQVVVSGDEILEVADVSELSVEQDLTPDKDVLLFHPYADGTRLRARDGSVAVFFPPDGHRPGLAVASPALVRKVVVKVPLP